MNRDSSRRQWATPILFLGAVSLTSVGALFSLDHWLNNGDFSNPLAHYLAFSPEAVSNSIGVLSSIVAAVLGIIITVVSIVVQLAATRYTPAITEIFFRDRSNLVVMSLYVTGCVIGLWVAFGVNDNWVPRASLLAMLFIATTGFLVMAPYFAYVFRMLSPERVVSRIENVARQAALAEGKSSKNMANRKSDVLKATERLTDIAINSVNQKDRIIAIACVDSLRDLLIAYSEGKTARHPSWFELDREVAENPDFSSMSMDSLSDIREASSWVEFKVLRQYQAIYNEALGTMRDINYVVAINTRLFAEKALLAKQTSGLELAIKFFNTYLRATINNNDVRTAYTILNHYRLLVEFLIHHNANDFALRIVGHIKYYGHLSYRKKLGFVAETVAYDLGAICEIAHAQGSEIEQQLLDLFLTVDPSFSEGEVQEASLRGVRKAQLKLATYYLAEDAESLARQVFNDMRDENRHRLKSIRDELLAIESKDFWEISDRGGNFDYLPPHRKEMLRQFFDWFTGLTGPVSQSADERPPTTPGP